MTRAMDAHANGSKRLAAPPATRPVGQSSQRAFGIVVEKFLAEGPTRDEASARRFRRLATDSRMTRVWARFNGHEKHTEFLLGWASDSDLRCQTAQAIQKALELNEEMVRDMERGVQAFEIFCNSLAPPKSEEHFYVEPDHCTPEIWQPFPVREAFPEILALLDRAIQRQRLIEQPAHGSAHAPGEKTATLVGEQPKLIAAMHLFVKIARNISNRSNFEVWLPPRSREMSSDREFRVQFACMLVHSMKLTFGRPLYADVSEIVNVFLDLDEDSEVDPTYVRDAWRDYGVSKFTSQPARRRGRKKYGTLGEMECPAKGGPS